MDWVDGKATLKDEEIVDPEMFDGLATLRPGEIRIRPGPTVVLGVPVAQAPKFWGPRILNLSTRIRKCRCKYKHERIIVVVVRTRYIFHQDPGSTSQLVASLPHFSPTFNFVSLAKSIDFR